MKRRIYLFLTLFLLTAICASAQTTTASGVVVDEASQPIIGATIREKGVPTNGTTTNTDGRFTIKVKSGATLIISYIGYHPIEMAAGSNMTIKMTPDSELLDEVVVTAMGISRTKKSIGYAAQEVKAEDLQKARVTYVNNALVGKVSGLRFLGGSGSNFDAGTIVLRGTNSLYNPAGAEPIYVIDGVITNKNALNMDDVASINVLKGPAATSLYGSQGGNGAIIVTTKSAKPGQSVVSISHTTLWEDPYLHAKVQKLYGGGYGFDNDEMPIFHWEQGMDPGLKSLDGQRYYDYGDDASWGPKFDGKPYIPYYAWDPTDPRYGQTAPWEFGMNLKELYRTGVSNTTNVAFSKSGTGYSTRISFTNVQRQGVNLNSDAVRRHISVKSDFDVNERLHVGLDWKYTFRRNHNVTAEEYGSFGSFLQEFLQWGNTNVKISDLKDYDIRPDGTFPTWNINGPDNLTPAYHDNPFSLMKYHNDYTDFQWNVFSFNADYKLFKGLSVGTHIYGNLRTMLDEHMMPYNFNGQTPEYQQQQNRTIALTGQIYAKYSDRYFDDRLTFDAMLFGEYNGQDYDRLIGGTTDGLILDKFWNIDASVGKFYASNTKNNWRTQSVFGTATLGFDDTYYLDLNLRNDWSSTLHPDHNSFLYGGASGSILMSSLIKADWLNYWKIRASIAQVGSTMDAYGIYPIMVTGDKYGQTVTMRQNRQLFNPEIKPTISSSYEVGTEFRLFKGRLYGDLNLYRKDSKNQILNQMVTPESGFTTRKINTGLIRNQGIEFTLGFVPVQTKDFTWDVNFNISKNQNTLVELLANDKDDDSYRISWYGFSTKIYSYAQEGRPIGIIRGTDFDYNDNGQLILKKRKDGSYIPVMNTKDDQKELGIAQPDFTGGFSTSLSYKNLTLSASMDFSVGGKLASTTNMWMAGSGIGDITAATNDKGKNVRDPLEDGGGYHLTGVDTEGKPVDTYIDGRFYYESLVPLMWGKSVYDATYIKLREISLAYHFDKALLSKLGIGLTGASISLVAQNPWLIYSAVPNIDPSESVGAFGNFLETGQAVSTRSFGATVSLTF